MVSCKKGGGTKHVKSGVVGGRQRYKCQGCGGNFREGDGRRKPRMPTKLAACILLYAMGKGSFRMPGKLFDIDHTYLYRTIRKFGENLPEADISGDIREMEFDEMRHFIGSEKQTLGHQGG